VSRRSVLGLRRQHGESQRRDTLIPAGVTTSVCDAVKLPAASSDAGDALVVKDVILVSPQRLHPLAPADVRAIADDTDATRRGARNVHFASQSITLRSGVCRMRGSVHAPRFFRASL
jgi:hypothetical protein